MQKLYITFLLTNCLHIFLLVLNSAAKYALSQLIKKEQNKKKSFTTVI